MSDDGSACHLRERYADSEAAMVHAIAFGTKYVGRFMEVVIPTSLTMYGSPSEELVKALAPFGPIVMGKVAGFTR